MDRFRVRGVVADGFAVYVLVFALVEAGLFALAVGCLGVCLGVDGAEEEGEEESGLHFCDSCAV